MPTINNKRRHRKKGAKRKARSASGSKRSSKIKLSSLAQHKDWVAWVTHLAKRRKPLPITHLVPDSSLHPLKWATGDAYCGSPSQSLVRLLVKAAGGKRTSIRHALAQLPSWLESSEAADPSESFALECLAWCHASPTLAIESDPDEWVGLIGRLRDVATEAVGIAVQEQPLEHQLLCGELAHALAYLYPELAAAKKLAKAAERSLSYGLGELLDGEGLPQCRYLGVFRQLLASWTRCNILCAESGNKCFDSESQLQYEWVVRQAICLARPDGTQVFSAGTKRDRHSELLVAAIGHAGDAADEAAAERALPGQHFRSKSRVEHSLPDPSGYSSWGEVCIMRPKWSRKSPLFCVTWGDRKVRSEMNASGELLWSDTWKTEVTYDGQRLQPSSDWDVVCWYSDADVDYLEVEADLGPSCRLQRQFVLAKLDQFLFTADAILGGAESAKIEYRCELPLVEDVQFHTDDETREGILWKKKPLASIIPVALPEWRLSQADGTLVVADGVTRYSRSATARNLYAPLFFDLSQRRLCDSRTWRQLTVAERLEIQPAEVAVGYRVQVGRAQWLFYRSLAERANRTVLGQNLSSEFLAARFNRDGTVDELIEIE
jgi:hypothetical protein